MNHHAHSLEAYLELEGVQCNLREQAVMQALQVQRMQGVPAATDRQVMELLGFTDMNAVRPRITALLQRGILEECGEVKCPCTLKTVRLVRLRSAAEIQADLMRAQFADRERQGDFADDLFSTQP